MAEDHPDSLITKTSLALSLSPPRAPPHDSAHRNLYLSKHPSEFNVAHHHDHHRYDHDHRGIRRRLQEMLEKSHFQEITRLPHPHLPYGPELGDQVTRALGVLLPLPWVNSWRDSGRFRTIIDGIVTVTAPTLAISSPSAATDFVRLTRRCESFQYGPHSMQIVNLLLPQNENHGSKRARHMKPRGFMVFVHGGAWGSGMPWMYRLVALPFLNLGMAVAIIGYRTYPDADAQGQVEDLEMAAHFLAEKFPYLCKPDELPLGTCIAGHSSGAHISLLLLVKRAEKNMQLGGRLPWTRPGFLEFTSFVGMSGPYDISHHFDYEAARGVEELSPMKPVCRHSREEFRNHSPAHCLLHATANLNESDSTLSIGSLMPRSLFIHGIEDSTVPFTSSAEAARILRSCGITQCDEIYVAQTGHQDTVMHLMLGGRSQDFIVDWLKSPRLSDGSPGSSSKASLMAKSKL